MTIRSLNRIANCIVFLGPIALACSGTTEPADVGTGGAMSASGGATSAVGGSTSKGGTLAASGGNGQGGVVAASGGIGQGGVPGSGGAGTAFGGNVTGGAATSIGGKATGGAVTNTGGKATGGAATSSGGKATGGAATNTGGKATGGAATSSGGKATGGAATSTGGSAVAGQSTGGQAAAGSTGDAVKSSGCGKTTTLTGQSTKTISVSGTNRTYIIRLPDNYDANHPYRLITSIHCLNGTASGVASGSTGTNYQFYGLWKLAAGSTIFVAPQGINNSWPGGAGDEGFIKALVTEIENTLCVDTTRVFSEGFSMGGSMSYALACAFSDTFRGVAVHSGGPMSGCNKTNRKPVAYFMTHGTKDSVCTYPGYGVPQINDFAQVNGCQTMDIPNTLKPTDTSGKTPVCGDYQGCSAGHPTRACIFVGDHTPSPGGEATTWVPAETWKFISQF